MLSPFQEVRALLLRILNLSQFASNIRMSFTGTSGGLKEVKERIVHGSRVRDTPPQ